MAPSDEPRPFDWVAAALDELRAEGLLRHKQVVTPRPGGRCVIEGREYVNFATNDYLDLAGDRRLAEAASQALQEAGVGARASGLVTGHTPWHQQLEERIARFEETEAAVLFPTGYAANLGALTSLAGRGDLVCGDRLNHASLIDGCRLCGATFRVYPHKDVHRLEHELDKHRSARRRLIVTDSLFSMDGDVAPLAELSDVAARHHAMLLIDEAHATGVVGRTGRGVAQSYNLEPGSCVRVGTLSKALGAQGGFAAGTRPVIDWLVNSARPQFFSTALSPPLCAAALRAFDIVDQEPQRRERLHRLCRQLREGLLREGISTTSEDFSPIVPVVVGDPQQAVNLSVSLRGRGFLVPAIRPPSVPRGTSRLRISVSAAHRCEDIDALCAVLGELWSTHLRE
jgi:8-amino-7-oxononanoate synthase